MMIPTSAARIERRSQYGEKQTLAVVLVSAIVSGCAFRLASVWSDDATVPTVAVTKPASQTVQARQYETPVVYHVFFDDENELPDDLPFDASFVKLNGFQADVSVIKTEKKGEYVLSLSNVAGSNGRHQVTIREGAAKDRAGNPSAKVTTPPFYLHDRPENVDREPPTLQVTGVPQTVAPGGRMEIVVGIADNAELSSTALLSGDVIPIGFTAQIAITRSTGRYEIVFSDLRPDGKEECCFAIVSGIAVDAWDNLSETFVSDSFVFARPSEGS